MMRKISAAFVMKNIFRFFLVFLMIFSGGVGCIFGQTAEAEAQLQTLLMSQQRALAAKSLPVSATPQARAAWTTENKGLIEARNLTAEKLGQISAAKTVGYVGEVGVPDNASKESGALLLKMADGYNQFALAQTKKGVTTENGVTSRLEAQSAGVKAEEISQRDSLGQWSQILAQQEAALPMKMPPPLVLPATISPQLGTYLRARDRLLRLEVTAWNQNLSAGADVQQKILLELSSQNKVIGARP